jgi:transposase
MVGMTPPPLTLQHERVDDIPLLMGVIEQLRLPAILDRHLGSHHLHEGLSNGTLAATWIAFILSEANHCKAPVQEWAHSHHHTLQTLLRQPLRPADFSDDRLAIVLRRFHQADWAALERDLWHSACEVYDIPMQGVRLDSTTSYGYHEVTDDGLMQFGHSKDHRPDLPQLKLMAAAAQPTSHVIASDIVPGNVADDVLYLPLIDRVRTQLKRVGLLYMGDTKMAALHIRADIVRHKDYYLTLLPRTGENAALIDTWVGEALAGKHRLQSFSRADQKGGRYLFARGCQFVRTCQAEVDGEEVVWSERVQLICTEALREHHGKQLELRLRAAADQVRGLTPPVGRGQRQYREEGALREAIAAALEEHKVVGLLEASWRREEYGSGVSGAKVRYEVTEVRRVEGAIAATKERCGWRVQVTNAPSRGVSLEQSMELYNGGWSVERDFHLVKDKPLGIQPLYVREEDQVDGLTKLLMIALRVLTWIELVVRGGLAEREEELRGLYEGQPKRKTSRPTAVRLLRAVSRMGLTLTRIESAEGCDWHVTPLPGLLDQILGLLGLGRELYTGLAAQDTG